MAEVDSTSKTLVLEESTIDLRPDLQNIKNSLRLLGWERTQLQLQKSPIRSIRNQPTKIVDDWGQWNESHPFFYFYGSRGEFNNAIESLNKNYQSVHEFQQQMQSSGYNFGYSKRWTQQHVQQQRQQLKVLSSNISVDIENQIASKLLEWIGQLVN